MICEFTSLCDLVFTRCATTVDQARCMTLTDSLHNYRFAFLLSILLVAGLYGGIVSGMAVDWYQDANYSHGFLVPLIAGYFVYERWDGLKGVQVLPSLTGLVVILIAFTQLIVGTVGVEYFTLRSSLVVLIAGMVLFFLGTEVFKIIRLPIFYLLFMIPLPYIIYDSLAFPLKQFVSWGSVGFMKLIGIAVIREGNIIMFPGITLEVADACSGIRSLISILALSVAYASFLQISNIKRWIIILSSVLIAIVTNAMRVIITGILANHGGAAAAQGFFHEFAGMGVFALAMAMLLLVGWIVRGKSS